MGQNILKKISTPTLSFRLIFYLIIVLIWVLTYLFYNYTPDYNGIVTDQLSNQLILSSTILTHILAFILTFTNGIMIGRMNEKYGLISVKTIIPTLLYFTLSTLWLPTHSNYIALLATSFFIISIHILLESYKRKNSVEYSFLSYFLLALSSMLVVDYLIFIIFFWILMSNLRSIGFKSFLASIIGFITPYLLFYTSIYLYSNQIPIIDLQIEQVFDISFLSMKNVVQIVYFFLVTLIFIIYIIESLPLIRLDNIQKRKYIQQFIILSVFIAILMLLRVEQSLAILPTAAFVFSISSGYILSLKTNLFNYILLLILVVSTIFFSIYSIFLPIL